MILSNILARLKLAVAKRAELKLGSIIKSIPMQGATAKTEGPKVEGPKAPTPVKSVSKPAQPMQASINTPSTYAGGIDLMAPSSNASGQLTSPGQAWSNQMGQQ